MDALIGLLLLIAALVGGVDRDPECLVLGGLDAVRREAFVTGDAARLRDVYVDRRAARADVSVLRSYRERRLRLEGMTLLRQSCRVVSRSTGRVVLDVVDRLGPTRVRSERGVIRELPRDRPTRRIVALSRADRAWRVAAVSAGPPRARTSRPDAER
jgi:hypothetical protein